MVLNIKSIYAKNIDGKYESMQCASFLKDFAKKERAMWGFTFMLLKDGWPKQEYDLDNIQREEYLTNYFSLFLNFYGDKSAFTLEDWADYMKKMA